MNTRTILIVGALAAVAGGVLYWRRNRAIAAAWQAEQARAKLLANPQIVANALRAATERRNAGGNLWKAMNP